VWWLGFDKVLVVVCCRADDLGVNPVVLVGSMAVEPTSVSKAFIVASMILLSAEDR